MSWRSAWKRVGRLIFRRAPADRDLDDEIRFHLAQETQRHVESGDALDEAQRAARRDFGSIAFAKENTRAVWVPTAIEQFWQDLKFGFRILTKSPAMSATAVTLVALVIGGNTTVFSIAHGILSKPAPGVTATGLVRLNWVADSGRPEPVGSYPTYQDLAAQSSMLRPMLASQSFVPFTLSHDDGSYASRGSLVTANYFETLGVQLTHGRAFTEEESQGGVSGIVVMISDRAWKNYFQGASDVIGRRVSLNGLPATVIGVTASGFHGTQFGESADIWAPLVSFARASGEERAMARRSDDRVAIIGRLAPEASLAEANAELSAIWTGLGRAYPELQQLKVTLVPYSLTRGGITLIDTQGDRFLLILSIVTLLTLVIVCANVANILIGRALVRQREMALRQALGASRMRIVRMLLAEGFAISCVAGVAAVLSTWWFSRAAAGLINFGGVTLPDFTPDWTVIVYAIVLVVVAMVAFTVAPIVRTWGLQLLAVLKTGEAGVVQGRSRLSSALVVTQLAFSVLLLTSAGWAYRSLFLLDTADLGFNPRNLLLVTVNTVGSAATADANAVLLDNVRDRLRGVTGVEHVSYARRPVLRDGGWVDVQIRSAGSSEPIEAEMNHVGPGYLEVLGTAPVAGRDFAAQEPTQSKPSVVVSQALVDSIWPGQAPLGQTLLLGDVELREVEVVGVIPTGAYSGFAQAHRRIMFLSAQQEPAAPGETTLHIRYTGNPDVIVPAITRRLQEADARAAVANIRTAVTEFDNVTSPVRLLTNLLVLFACGSLLIAVIGQYAVVAFDMQRRVRELGLRMALGASSRQILGSVLRDGCRFTVVGLAIGFGLSLAAGTSLRGPAYGVTPTDPLTYLGVFALLSFASLLACYLPARRASRINPMMALRCE